jgi:heme/copper-type cytochrome/quinol oxidase subunit 4
MENRKRGNAIAPMLVFFLLVNSFCLLFRNWLDAKGIDHAVVIFANCILFILSLLIFFMHKRSAQNTNPNVFVRSVMAGTLIKLFVIAGAMVVYLKVAGENKSVYGIMAGIGLYFIYTFIEVKSASRLNKEHGRS